MGELTVKSVPSYIGIIGEHLQPLSTHTVEKLYECKDCRKRFKHRTSFKIHRRTHCEETTQL